MLLLYPIATSAKYASIVINPQSGIIHHSVNADTRNFPASLTKLMTLYLLFDAIKRKKLAIDTKLKVSYRAAIQPASKLGLKAGQKIEVRKAIHALIIKSANDVATVVAESLAGNERRFALLMTDKARKLGMSRTTFRNASGLAHRGQMSTARDMATLAMQLIKRFPEFYHYFSKTSFTYQGRTYRTHNKVLKNFPGAEGMKTGYIRASGYNLITTAKRNGHRLVGVIFGGDSARSRDRHMTKLLKKSYIAVDSGYNTIIRDNHKRSIKIFGTYPSPKTNNKQKNRATWGIQIGAFYNRKPAIDIALKLLKKHPNLLGKGRISIMPIKKSGYKVLFRARILSISMNAAYRACRLLKRNRKPCMPLRIPLKVEIASR